jgi:esterase/lipase superfamily enzyme
MLKKSFRMTPACVGLLGIVFLWGCGSEPKPSAPPEAHVTSAEKNATLEAEKNAAHQDVVLPSPTTTDGSGLKSTAKARPKMLMKKSSPPKPQGAPMEPSKMAASPPVETDDTTNPMRGTAPPPMPQINPIRTDDKTEGEPIAETAPVEPDDSAQPMGRKLYLRQADPGEGDMLGEAAEPAAPAPEAAESAAATPAGVDAKMASAPDQSEYTLVKVFYGTDRAQLVPLVNQPAFLAWALRAVAAAIATACLFFVGFRLYPSIIIRVLAYCGIFATGLLTALWINSLFQKSGTQTPSSPAMIVYGGDRGKLELGVCEVSIPKSHEVGELESPSIFRLEFSENSARHVILQKVQPEPAEQFFNNLRECVGRSSQKSAFVFVHGYNVTFIEAARRTAQIAYDLKFDGVPIFYSWPSQAQLLQYTVDETNVAWTVPHLLKFLTDVAEQSGAERIHLIAHSMGNRALTSALRDLALSRGSAGPSFDEVVLTAPDVDADVFINDIAPAIVKTAKRVTLYASSNDEALVMSKKVHGYPRAGDSGSQLIVVPGVDTVDVSIVDTSLLGHAYYGDNSTVLADIFELLAASKPADQRQWLRAEKLGLLKYWVFHQ